MKFPKWGSLTTRKGHKRSRSSAEVEQMDMPIRGDGLGRGYMNKVENVAQASSSDVRNDACSEISNTHLEMLYERIKR